MLDVGGVTTCVTNLWSFSKNGQVVIKGCQLVAGCWRGVMKQVICSRSNSPLLDVMISC